MAPATGVSPVQTLRIFSAIPRQEGKTWTNDVSVLSEFLQRTCLTYCEFLELSETVISTQFVSH